MTTSPEDRAGLAPEPPTSPGDVPAGSGDRWGGERDPADNWGVTYSEPLPSVGGSPHWDEIKT